jgi:hypothetical protein
LNYAYKPLGARFHLCLCNNFGAPTANETFFDVKGNPVGGAGAVNLTSTTAREIQFALKLIF